MFITQKWKFDRESLFYNTVSRRENKFKGRKMMRKWYLSIKKVGRLMHALRKKMKTQNACLEKK
jgi:hypothetical protein